MKKDTIINISQRTGFSISTISRVLSGQAKKYRISDKTVKIITDDAQQCNYSPSLLAKGLRLNKTHTLGLIIPSIDNPFFANIASIIISEARKMGYTIILVDTMEDEQNEKEGIRSLVLRKVDGILVVPCGKDPSFIESINSNSVPIILIDRYFQETSLSYVGTDNYKGAFEGTDFLIKNGHKQILCISGTPWSMPVKERLRGFKDALDRHGLFFSNNIIGDSFSINNGYISTKLALNSENIPTAIFALSNTILLGAIKAIKEAGLSIPEDISIISFDNNIFLDFLDPSITRINQPINEIGTLATKLLIQYIEDKKYKQAEILMSPQLHVCKSVNNKSNQ